MDAGGDAVDGAAGSRCKLPAVLFLRPASVVIVVVLSLALSFACVSQIWQGILVGLYMCVSGAGYSYVSKAC